MLKQAARIVEDRRHTYGDPRAVFELIAKRWSITLGCTVTPQQVAICMIDLKLARLAMSPRHVDSMIDIAGYVAVLEEITR